MAGGSKKYSELPMSTIIEVVATKRDKVIKSKMTYSEALTLKKKIGWTYRNYQLGVCSMRESS